MPRIPSTSVTLLKDISNDASSVRWNEFIRIYDAPMRDFLQRRFPYLEADDVIQETLIALIKKLPNYHYVPDSAGHFRNYLMGIVKHKALDILRKNRMRSKTIEGFKRQPADEADPAYEQSEQEWREAAAKAALDQLLADTSINSTHREVFFHLVRNHEKPEKVAELFGFKRNNVDVIKNRLCKQLRELVATMTD